MSSPQNDLPPPRPVQFRLRTLLGFVAFSAVLLGVCQMAGIDPRLALFGIGLFALFGLIVGLISVSQRSMVVVYETPDAADASLCEAYLRRHGIRAFVLDRARADLGILVLGNFRVGVPAGQAEAARELLARRRRGA